MSGKLSKRISVAREEGFTLIELLIVIVILGILAGIVTFGVAQFRTDSEVAACKADKENVETAQEAYAAKNAGDYADSVAQLVPAYLKAAPATASGITTSDSGAVASTLSGC